MIRFILVSLTITNILADQSDAVKNFNLANNKFTADVYKELKLTENGNFVACPISAEVVLTLIHAGSSGNTAKELSNGLHLPETREAIDSIYRELHPSLQANQDYTLRSANKIYVENKCTVGKQYKTTATDIFGAEVQSINFQQDEAAVSEINKWVTDHTNGKITKLIANDDIAMDTRIILLNAIYFRGKWTRAFKTDNTSKRPFYLDAKSYVNVDMMDQTQRFRYYHSSKFNAKYIELPYKGNNITMTLVLPDSVVGLPALEEHIHEVLAQSDFSWKEVNLRMPKSKIETKIQFIKILQKLGIHDVFGTTADLSLMLDNSREPLYISKVVQKALIETDEEGTTAAAATAGIAATYSAVIPEKPINFHANHPYIFWLKHKEAGILFIGRYSSPSGNKVFLDKPVQESD